MCTTYSASPITRLRLCVTCATWTHSACSSTLWEILIGLNAPCTVMPAVLPTHLCSQRLPPLPPIAPPTTWASDNYFQNSSGAQNLFYRIHEIWYILITFSLLIFDLTFETHLWAAIQFEWTINSHQNSDYFPIHSLKKE